MPLGPLPKAGRFLMISILRTSRSWLLFNDFHFQSYGILLPLIPFFFFQLPFVFLAMLHTLGYPSCLSRGWTWAVTVSAESQPPDHQGNPSTSHLAILDRIYRLFYKNKHSSPFLLFLFSCQVMSDSCDPMDSSIPGFPVLHYLPEFAQTHVHWVSDAIQPSHPLPSPSPPALSLPQHQGLSQWVSSSHQGAKELAIILYMFYDDRTNFRSSF